MKFIAKVFDHEITLYELEREFEKIRRHEPSIDSDTLHNNALYRVIDRYLLLHEAEKSNISICDEEYEATLMDIIDNVENLDDIEHDLAIKGMPPKQIEKLIRNKIVIKKFIESLCCDRGNVDDEDIAAFYEEQKKYFFQEKEVRASHILVKGTDQESKDKIEAIYKSLKSPEDFFRVSNQCSDCPSHAKCGDLGFFGRGKLLAQIDEVAFNLKINEISEPFVTQYGYHILMVTDIREQAPISFEEIKDSLRARLSHIEKEYYLSRYIRNLRELYKTAITIY